jgi:hypothetical protein
MIRIRRLTVKVKLEEKKDRITVDRFMGHI